MLCPGVAYCDDDRYLYISKTSIPQFLSVPGTHNKRRVDYNIQENQKSKYRIFNFMRKSTITPGP